MKKIRLLRILFPVILTGFMLYSCGNDTKGQRTPIDPPGDSDRQVGIAYSLWNNIRLWETPNGVWDTPLTGIYDSRDRRIIRKHAEQLHDAGVDFIWLDWSNNVIYDPEKYWQGGEQDVIEDATFILFDEYSKLSRKPRISIFIGITDAPESVQDGRLQKKADQVWNMYYNNPKYKDLIQTYLGKPLLVVYTDTPSPWQTGLPPWDDNRFTVRWMTGFVTEQKPLITEDLVSKYGYWSWEDRGKQSYTVHDGKPESMVICAATREQEGSDGWEYIPEKGRRNGETFKEQWARAREIGPHFAMVVSWNEWTTGEQLSLEISKDIEPSQQLGDFYLRLMKEEIKKFKNGDK